MKKILLTIFVFTLIFIIYYINLDKKIYFFSLGDYLTNGNEQFGYQDTVNKYLKEKNLYEQNVIYAKNGDYRIVDMIHDIEDNVKFNYNGKEYTLNNALIKADLITISIGMNDLLYNKLSNDMSYEYVDEVMKDLDYLLKLIRSYSKEKIFIFNYYGLSSKQLVEYANNKLQHIADRYNITVIDISDIDGYLKDSIYPNNNYYSIMGIKINKLLKTIY